MDQAPLKQRRRGMGNSKNRRETRIHGLTLSMGWAVRTVACSQGVKGLYE